MDERTEGDPAPGQPNRERVTPDAAANQKRGGSETPPNQRTVMKLAPKDPPDRSTRRARGFAADIGQLRAQGYTLEAIRTALAEAGVSVSKSTVQREVARLAAGPSSGPDAIAEHSLPIPDPAPAPFQTAPASATGLLSGKDIAEAFASTWNANPLFRQRSTE